MELSHSFCAALRQFSYAVANGTVGHPLLKDIDYLGIFRREPCLMELAYAIFANNIDMDENGLVLNARYAECRAAQYIRQYCDSSFIVDPPLEEWEMTLY